MHSANFPCLCNLVQYFVPLFTQATSSSIYCETVNDPFWIERLDRTVRKQSSSFNASIIKCTEGKLTVLIVRAEREKQRCPALDNMILSHAKYKCSLTDRHIPADCFIDFADVITVSINQWRRIPMRQRNRFILTPLFFSEMLDMLNICNFVCVIRKVLLE